MGSFPHLDGVELSQRLSRMIDIPDWPQLSRTTFRENMYVQFTPALPAILLDEDNEKVTFDTTVDIIPALETFYERYLSEDLDAFGLDGEYAAGFYVMLEMLRAEGSTGSSRDAGSPGSWIKGKVTGPVSLGLTVTDQDLRASLYDDLLADAIVKNAAMNARWQVRQLKTARPHVIIFVDEPYMASFGSAYISLSREQVVEMFDEVFAAIHVQGALAGVHCCGNTDWSVLLATTVDILNLDAYGYLEHLALYPAELRAFLDRGGVIAWGLVPNNDDVWEVTPQGLAVKLREGLELICQKADRRGVNICREEFVERSLITTSCGLGPTSVKNADRALELLVETGEILMGG